MWLYTSMGRQNQSLFSTTLLIGSVAIVAVVGLGLLVYLKKRKTKVV